MEQMAGSEWSPILSLLFVAFSVLALVLESKKKQKKKEERKRQESPPSTIMDMFDEYVPQEEEVPRQTPIWEEFEKVARQKTKESNTQHSGLRPLEEQKEEGILDQESFSYSFDARQAMLSTIILDRPYKDD